MKTFRILGLALFAIILCLSACSDGDNPIEPTPNPDNGKPEVSIDSSILSNGLSFTDGAGEKSISFIAKDNWTLSIASTRSGISWCTPSATSGPKGNANVKFTVTENTSYDDRSVSVTIKSGFAAETFTISQKGVDALLVTTDKYEVCQEGGIIDIEVKANIEYKMEISEASKDWIKESSSRSLTAYKHTLNIATNEGMEKREGEIHFKSGDKVETVKVYQAGGAILLLSQNEYNVSDKGDTISVDIKSNMEFGVQMPNVDWIVDEASARGLSSHTLNYIVAANEEYDSRSADIIFYDKNSDLKDTLKVVQAPKGALVITQKEYNVEAESEIINVKFNTNVNCNYVLLDSCDWIKAVDDKTRVLKEYELSFKIDENWSGAKRIAKIAIFDSMSSVSDTILINQNTIPDNEIWYRTNDDSAWNLSVGESFGNTYTNGKGVISYNTPITMIKDFFWSQSSEMKNTLVELVFPNSLEYIGSGAFGCTGLKKVTIPAGVKIIADNAIYECKDLKEIVFMNGLEEIKHSAFHSCSSLKNVTFPASFRELGDNAFYYCI